jgi:NADH-quinone oxidoreductase subunit J
VIAFVVQLIGVLSRSPDKPRRHSSGCPRRRFHRFPGGGENRHLLADGRLPDVHLIGRTLFTEYNLPLQILGVLLLVATIGVVALSRKNAE